jgi:hypothetical protein
MVTETISVPKDADVEITENDDEVVVGYDEQNKLVFEGTFGSELVLHTSDEFEIIESTNEFYEDSMFVSTPEEHGVNGERTDFTIVEENSKYSCGFYFVEMRVE